MTFDVLSEPVCSIAYASADRAAIVIALCRPGAVSNSRRNLSWYSREVKLVKAPFGPGSALSQG